MLSKKKKKVSFALLTQSWYLLQAFLTCASPSTARITGVQTRFLGTTDASGSCHSPEQVGSFPPANGLSRLTISPFPFYSYAA